MGGQWPLTESTTVMRGTATYEEKEGEEENCLNAKKNEVPSPTPLLLLKCSDIPLAVLIIT